MAFIRGVFGKVVIIRSPSALNTLAERGGEDRITIMDQEPQRAQAVIQVHGEVAACCATHAPVGRAVTPATCSLRVPCSMYTSAYSRWSSTVSTTRKSQAMMACAWAVRNCGQVA
jgi:hypothetical protein